MIGSRPGGQHVQTKEGERGGGGRRTGSWPPGPSPKRRRPSGLKERVRDVSHGCAQAKRRKADRRLT
jgi:hypothetical protein